MVINIIKKISTNVDNVIDKELFFPLNDVFKKYVGDYYSPFKIKLILDELDQLIDQNNLQFVEHTVEEIIETETINIVFNISFISLPIYFTSNLILSCNIDLVLNEPIFSSL